MGWDIVALGTHHTLPIDNPIEIAKRLIPICDGPISVGYFKEWIYDVDSKRIYQPEGMYDWIEISHIDTGRTGAVSLEHCRVVRERAKPMNYTAAASQNENILMEYMVEVITLDGESEIVYVEARTSEEA